MSWNVLIPAFIVCVIISVAFNLFTVISPPVNLISFENLTVLPVIETSSKFTLP